MRKFLIYSSIGHILLFLIIKIDFQAKSNLKEKSISISMVEEKIKTPKEKKKQKIPQKKKEVKIEKNKLKKDTKKKVIKKPKKKKVVKKSSKDFDDMLKNLAKEDFTEKPIKNNNFEETLKNIAKKDLFSKPIKPKKGELQQIEELILKQVNNNWSRPPGIKTSDNLNVKLTIYLNYNGDVIDLKINEQTRKQMKENIYLKPYLDSAIRAIQKSSPFEGLKKDRYNIWKIIIINFKPREAM